MDNWNEKYSNETATPSMIRKDYSHLTDKLYYKHNKNYYINNIDNDNDKTLGCEKRIKYLTKQAISQKLFFLSLSVMVAWFSVFKNVLMTKSILVFEAFSVVNIALKKPSELSSMYEPAHYECCDSDYAVDGYIHDWVNGDFFCAHTDHVEDKQEWWSVDLQDVYTIDYTYIYGRTDCCGK